MAMKMQAATMYKTPNSRGAPRWTPLVSTRPARIKGMPSTLFLVGLCLSKSRKRGTNTMVKLATKLAVEAGIRETPRRSKTRLKQTMAAKIALRQRTRPLRSRSRAKNTMARMMKASPEVMVM